MFSFLVKHARQVLSAYAALGGLGALVITRFDEISAMWILLVGLGCLAVWEQLSRLSSRIVMRFARSTVLLVFFVSVGVWYQYGGLHATVEYAACGVGVSCSDAVHWRIARALKPLQFSGFRKVVNSTDGNEPTKENADELDALQYCTKDFDDVEAVVYSIHNPSPENIRAKLKYSLRLTSEDWKIVRHFRKITNSMADGGLADDPLRSFDVFPIIFESPQKTNITYYVCLKSVNEKKVTFVDNSVELVHVIVEIDESTTGGG